MLTFLFFYKVQQFHKDGVTSPHFPSSYHILRILASYLHYIHYAFICLSIHISYGKDNMYYAIAANHVPQLSQADCVRGSLLPQLR